MVSLWETPVRDLLPFGPALTLGLWSTAAQAARTLLDAEAGEALVLDHGRPLGVVTTRGLARVLAAHGRQTPHLAVQDVMNPVAVSQDTAPLAEALRHLLAAPARRLAVVDAQGRAKGLVAPCHMARACRGLDDLASRTVAQAMTRAVVTALPDDPLPLVLGRMSRAAVGGVAVVEDDRPRGMFTSRDAMLLLAEGREPKGLCVAEVMRAPVAAISPQLPLAEALAGMDGAGAGRLTVTDAAGFLCGLLTWTDMARTLSEILREAENQRLREQAAQLRELYDHAPQGLFRLDLDGQPLTANKTLARLLGYGDTAEFMRQARQGAHPLRLDDPERRELLIQALSGSEPVAFETCSVRHDGTSSRVYCVVRAARDALGFPVYLEGTCADFPVGMPPQIAAQPESDLGGLVGRQTELVYRADPQGRLIRVNAAFARYWGKTPEECVAGRFQPDIPEEDREQRARRLAALRPDRPTTGFEHRVVRPDGRMRWQRWTCRAVFDASGTLLEYQAVGRDITGRKRAEARLMIQGNFAQTLLEAMPAPVFFKDAAGRYQGCNKAFESLLGLPRDRLLGRTVHEIHPPDLADVYVAMDSELMARGGRQVYEASLRTAGGGLRDMVFRKAVHRDGCGNAAGLIGIVFDITDRKQAEAAVLKVRDDLEEQVEQGLAELGEINRRLVSAAAERQRAEEQLRRTSRFLETVLNAIQDGICVLSPDLTVIKVNRAMDAMCDQGGKLEGRACHEAFHGLALPCGHCPALRAMTTRKLAISVVPRVDASGTAGWVELFCYPLFDENGAVTGVAEIVRDVTASKKLEAELAAALERAEAGSQAKGEFLANMSHEIRTPLNAVLGYVQLMLRDSLEPRQRERLAVVEESAEALLSIINDILDYSKIEAGRLELKSESFDLVRCLEAVVREQELLARNKGLRLILCRGPGLPRAVRGDGLRLRQILRNLINNAVKYTEKGSVVVTVSLEGRETSDQGGPDRVVLRFAVADTGVGIPETQQAAIFDSFTQVNGGLTKHQAGTGLGLAICRRLAELMGGCVSMKSRLGAGSVFWLTCSFEEAPALAPVDCGQIGEPRDGNLPRLRILLVEDNQVNRVFASDLLQSQGHEVAMAGNGREALDFLAEQSVDVVLMDIQMPVMDGLTATRAIRAGHRDIDPGLPVVGLSAYAMDQERERFLAAGLDDYIIKPIAVDEFFRAVGRALAKHGRPPVLGAQPARAPRAEAVLDTASLFAQYRHKAGLLARVGREFLSSVPEQLQALEAALGHNDLSVCERVAHTLKGNAAMFGAAAMRSLAAEVEKAAAEGDAAQVQALWPALAQACQSVLRHMGAFLGRLEG